MGKRSKLETEKIRSKNHEPSFKQAPTAQETTDAPEVPPSTPTKVSENISPPKFRKTIIRKAKAPPYTAPIVIDVEALKDEVNHDDASPAQMARLQRIKNLYEVEKIVDHKPEGTQLRCTQYRIKWKNFPARFNSWESAVRISNEVPTIVDFYWRKVKSDKLNDPDNDSNNEDEPMLEPSCFEVEIIVAHKPEESSNEQDAEAYSVQFVGFVKPEWVRKYDIQAEYMIERYWKRFHKKKLLQIGQKRELCRREQTIKKEIDSIDSGVVSINSSHSETSIKPELSRN